MASAGDLSVAILAGGQSRRMGQDKALLEIRGKPLIQYVVEAARTVSDDISIVASDRPEYESFGLPVLPDKYPRTGSLGGIYTAVSYSRAQHCLVLACDMPFVSPELLKFMAEAPRGYDVLVPSLPEHRSSQGTGETLETLHAIYSKSCLPAMERQLNAGVYKIIGFFTEVKVQKLDGSEIEKIDPAHLSFFNANTPDEFEEVLANFEQ